MPKKIVICCDGTGNQIDAKLSNVLKLFRIIEKNDEQLVYYSPGVGTVGDFDDWQLLKQHVREFLGLATGYGLDENVRCSIGWPRSRAISPSIYRASQIRSDSPSGRHEPHSHGFGSS